MKGEVTLVSCGVSPADLTDRHRAAVAGAEVLAGGQRLLDWFPEFNGEKIVLAGHTAETVAELAARAREARIVVLASGDALFFGVGRLFAARLEPDRLTVLPNITAAQAAFARLCLSWENARFFSVHGRAEPLPWRRILQAPVAVIYADATRTPAALASELVQRWPPARNCRAAIVADLGGADERCIAGTLADMADGATGGLAMLIVYSAGADFSPALPLGLNDDGYAHEADLITHAEVRAVALAKLQLGPGVLWDVGAGSGSVGIEAAGLCEGLAVYAVEKSAARCGHIRENAARAGCGQVQVVTGVAPAIFAALPAPRSVFVGGGGADARAIVQAAFERLLPGGTLVAAAVMLETRAALLACLPERRNELVDIEVRRGRAFGPGHRLEPGNPVALFVFRKGAAL
jgi:precorrin-6Y C5,15-methyltransferase (decarboxylating)